MLVALARDRSSCAVALTAAGIDCSDSSRRRAVTTIAPSPPSCAATPVSAAGAPSCATAGWTSVAAARMVLTRKTDFRSEEHTSELQSLMRISYAVFCLKKKQTSTHIKQQTHKINIQY